MTRTRWRLFGNLNKEDKEMNKKDEIFDKFAEMLATAYFKIIC